MARIRRLVLDVLKARDPGVLELGARLAEQEGLKVRLTVLEIDDKTETLRIEVSGEAIDFQRLRDSIEDFGASLHSIDEVEVDSDNGNDA